MSAATIRRSQLVAIGAGVVLLAAMALDTTVVRIGSGAALRSGAFSPATYGTAEFPKVRDGIEHRAVDATVLAAAIAKDADAAGKQYGVPTDAGPEFSVKFTGTIGSGDSGVYDVTIPGMPADVHVTLQTGPAIIGTDLRDATGTISFGQFHNQIEYQNAGAAINNAMKRAVLAKIDTSKLSGRTVSVVGAFQLTDPANWQVTPVAMDVR